MEAAMRIKLVRRVALITTLVAIGCAGNEMGNDALDGKLDDAKGGGPSDTFVSDQLTVRTTLSEDGEATYPLSRSSLTGIRIAANRGNLLTISLEAVDPNADVMAFVFDQSFALLKKSDDTTEGTNPRFQLRMPYTGEIIVVGREVFGQATRGRFRVEGIAPIATDDLGEFLELSNDAKMQILFSDYSGDDVESTCSLTLSDGLVERDIRLSEELDGEQKDKALQTYFRIRDSAFAFGADGVPVVRAIEKNGVVFAFSFSTSGSFHSGSWGQSEIYDAELNAIGHYGCSE